MNRVQFSMPARNINVTKLMIAPKNRTDTNLWLKQARKAIPQIPDTLTRTDWKVYDEIISDQTILLDIRDNMGNKCAVIIERKSTMSKI